MTPSLLPTLKPTEMVTDCMIPLGSIHGRFQPFHNAHLAYAMAALQHVERLYIGLTKVLTEETIGQDIAPHRFKPEENPLTYYQRVEVTTRALLEAGVAPVRFDVGPFPVEVPDRLPEFWPKTGPCFTTNVGYWNQRKIEILTGSGYDVTVLDLDLSGVPVTSGSKIRELFRAGDQSWHDYVPKGTTACILEHGWII
jgi:nicotinamide mononucleotide adenylyltransferase